MRRSPEEAAQTRRALLTAALEVFAERGYASATLAGIAERAGLTRGAVYHHFTDKAALYLATIAENWGEAAGPVWAHLEHPHLEPWERIRRFLVAFFTAFEHNATLRTTFAMSMQGGEFPELHVGLEDKRRVMDAWANQLTELLTAAGESGQGAAVAPESGAIAIIAAVNGVAATWLACPDLFSPAAQADALAHAILHGVLSAR
ncbi:TetR/AcrR family transcriptional regulator [Amycolatopsis sp. NPDC051071]|uniref:TetR/AcrR family transcriptional regulator n=1 Tax=Amycolatopsis sp. NPDC051071 TaxID=3154637 RepID=UPI00344A9B7D